MDPNLRSCQADTTGGIHAAQHVASQVANALIHLADPARITPKRIVAKSMNIEWSSF
jgi:hypothetical protein